MEVNISETMSPEIFIPNAALVKEDTSHEGPSRAIEHVASCTATTLSKHSTRSRKKYKIIGTWKRGEMK